ncbi:hypothetical protein GMB70_13400 [Turicibacter sanguinis]|nr:hypothetical protein [Turicibacter sanguinis]
MSRLKEKIEFILDEPQFDPKGFKTSDYTVKYTCRANKKVLSSTKEFLLAHTTQYREVLSFKVRSCKFIQSLDTKRYQVRYLSKLYNIKAIDDSDSMYVMLKVECIS